MPFHANEYEQDTDGIESEQDRTNAIVVYILYFLGFLWGLTVIPALILAYIWRRNAAPKWRSHFTMHIRTFWIGLAVNLVLLLWFGSAVWRVLIGADWADIHVAWTSYAFIFVFACFLFIWLLVRGIRGFVLALGHRAYPNPTTWLW